MCTLPSVQLKILAMAPVPSSRASRIQESVAPTASIVFCDRYHVLTGSCGIATTASPPYPPLCNLLTICQAGDSCLATSTFRW